MAELKELDINYKMFLDRSTVLYGTSNAGKSTVIVDILYHLKPHIDTIVVFCPTDRLNNTYSKNIPSPFIHYELNLKTIQETMKRQEVFATVFRRAQNPVIIERLFNLVANGAEKRLIAKLTADAKESQNPQVNDILQDFKMLAWKHTINRNRHKFTKFKLLEDEEFTLDHLNFNGRLVMVFDDCTEQLRKNVKTESMQTLFYQGRHNLVTFIIACHDDTVIPRGLRDNVFVRFYMTREMATKILLRDKSKTDKETNTMYCEIIKNTFTPMAKWQKLVYVADNSAFYRFTAKPRPGFNFCNETIRKYCDAIKAEANTLPSNNAYTKYFT